MKQAATSSIGQASKRSSAVKVATMGHASEVTEPSKVYANDVLQHQIYCEM